MNLERIKEKLIKELSIDPANKEYLNNIMSSFSAGVEIMKKQNEELIKLLGKVKNSMDSEEYFDDFDTLYDEISAVLKESGK